MKTNAIDVQVSALPQTIQSALSALGYGRRDISIVPTETETVFVGGGDGYRGFACMVDMATGSRQVSRGSWGGSNMFNPRNAVDLDDSPKPLPQGFALIKGHEGGSKPVYASIYVSPDTLNRFALPDPTTLSDAQAYTLAAYIHYRSCPYRVESIQKAGATPAEIDALVSGGLLLRNKAGATQITAAGRNAYRAAVNAGQVKDGAK